MFVDAGARVHVWAYSSDKILRCISTSLSLSLIIIRSLQQAFMTGVNVVDLIYSDFLRISDFLRVS